MLCIIKIVDGIPFQHPIMLDNFTVAFPDIDIRNLPPEYAYFNRIERPILPGDKVFEQDDPVYRFVDGMWSDVWLTRDKTQEELDQEIIQKYRLMKEFAEPILPLLTNAEDTTLWSSYISDIETAMQAPSPLTWRDIPSPRRQNNTLVRPPI